MKQIMVDLDDTLVSFSEMFCDRWNRYVRKYNLKFIDTSKPFSINNITEYNILTSLKQFYNNNMILNHYDRCMEEIFEDETFYNNPYLTPEYYKIFNLLNTTFKNDNLILNTKVSTYEMMISKINLFKRMDSFNIFNQIILDMEKSWYHTPKPTHYDVMIDDAPHNIENYLEKNPNGIVYMPLREFNKHLKDNKRIIVL